MKLGVKRIKLDIIVDPEKNSNLKGLSNPEIIKGFMDEMGRDPSVIKLDVTVEDVDFKIEGESK